MSCFHVLRSQSLFPRYRGCQVPFSYFVLPESFSTVLRALSLVFMFCASRIIFGGNEGVVYHFHFLRSRSHFPLYRGRWVPLSCFARRTRFRRYRGCPVMFSCFAVPDNFSAVRMASGLIFMFCEPVHVFGGAECVGSHFHVLCAQTYFSAVSRRRVLFSCFARRDMFLAVPRASGLIFMFCAPGHIFNGTKGVGSRFHVLHARTRFRRKRG
jgi:hypothetical protein